MQHRRTWIAAGALMASVLLAGCGDSKAYTAADVQHAFGAAGIQLSVLIDPQALGPSPGSKSLNTIAKHGPKILGMGGDTKNMSVLVYPHASDARAEEARIKRLISDAHAHPDRYPKGAIGQLDDNGVARIANVLVFYRKSAPGLSHQVSNGVDGLR